MNRKELHDFIKEKQPNICQISCYKDGKEVYSDEWNNYKKGDTCHVMSATKSIVALLVGIALDKEFIKSIDQSVLDFFPEYKIKRGEKTIQKVTIKHLLTMTAPYKYKYEPWTKICSSDDLLWSSIFVTLMANKIGGLQFGIYRNCQISSRVFHTAVAALPLTKANRSDFE